MKTIYNDNTILTKDKKVTYLTTDVSAGSSSLAVQSIVGFTSTAQILLIGKIGEEYSEIAFPSHATAPSGSTIYLYGTLTFEHSQDTPVYAIDWDELQFWHSSTITGTKSLLSTMSIQPDALENYYNDTSQTSGYYFTRFRNNQSIIVSDFSDPIPYSGYADNTVFMIKKRALESQNEKISDLITHEYLNESLWEARREYHKAPGKRPFRRKDNVVLGEVETGMYRIVAPSDLEKPYTAENIFGVRIGTEKNMQYYDKKEWDADYEGVAHTYLNAAYTKDVDQDLWCNDVSDFEDSGSVNIENDIIEYSAKGVSGGTLRISVHGSYSHAIEKDVWQNASMGLPDHFTVFTDAYGTTAIYFNCPIDTAYVSQNIYADYYRTLVEYDSDADELDEPEFDMFVPYLSFKIKKKKEKGISPLNDPDYQLWTLKKQNALAAEYLGTEIRILPNIEHLSLP